MQNNSMAGVASRFRQSLTKALSIDSDNSDEKTNGESSLLGNIITKLTTTTERKFYHVPRIPTDARKHKTLLVVDTCEHDWSKTFRGRSLHNGAIDIRIEQASFADLQIVSSSRKGASVSMKVLRNGHVVARSFCPDFVLIREYLKGPSTKTDHKHFLLGLMHGLVPGVNTLNSTYSFLDKPLVYAELLKIQQSLGRDNFPLIEQTYYQSYQEMLMPPNLPVVVKIGSVNSGFGKVCVASPRGFQDVASIVAMTNLHAISEPFLEGKFDIRIMRIGQRYKVFKRKSLNESWKTNTGASSVEEIALTERYKNWVDECSMLFGGLDIVCVEAIHTVDDREYIVEVNDIPMSICPDKRLDDMKCIANIVTKRMEQSFTPIITIDSSCTPGNSLTDAIQLISGPPTPKSSPKSGNICHQSLRPESAPPVEFSGMTYNSSHRSSAMR